MRLLHRESHFPIVHPFDLLFAELLGLEDWVLHLMHLSWIKAAAWDVHGVVLSMRGSTCIWSISGALLQRRP